jgi:hypothetical protein
VAGGGDKIPRYSHRGLGTSPSEWEPDEDDVERSQSPQRNSVLRGLSVVPFALVAAIGLIAAISWPLVIVFGLGGGEPIWAWAKGHSLAHVFGQFLLAVGIGLIPVGVMLLASWAMIHGFREWPSPYFWPVAQVFWSVLAVGLVYVDRARHEWLHSIGLNATDWWFGFAVVAFAMIMAGLRIRAQRAGRTKES